MSYFKNLYSLTHNINTKVLGEVANYTTIDGDEFELENVIFDNNYEAIDQFSDTQISTNICVASCNLNNFPDGILPREGDEIEIDSQSYQVTDSQEDGQGGTKLVLHRI